MTVIQANRGTSWMVQRKHTLILLSDFLSHIAALKTFIALKQGMVAAATQAVFQDSSQLQRNKMK